MITFCFDHLLPTSADGYYPNLIDPASIVVNTDNLPEAQRPNGLGEQYPFIDYCRLLDQMREYNVEFSIQSVDSAPVDSVYLVDINYFDHGIDYFALMRPISLTRLQQREIKLVFIYCEADNPARIQKRLYQLADIHSVNPLDIFFALESPVTSCTPANFLFLDAGRYNYESGHKELYSAPLEWHDRPRSKKMTYLNRVHKSWRAFFAAWYWQQGYAADSYFSYCHVNTAHEDMSLEGNPLKMQIKADPEWKRTADQFLLQCPFYTDQQTDQERNYVGNRIDQHFTDSYWNLSAETFLTLDDNWPGVLITEKTWKPIAQAQPFVVLGNAGTLQALRQYGFRTFGEVGIDESYDYLLDNTARFQAVMKTVSHIHSLTWQKLHQLNLSTRGIVQHNQKLFWDIGPELLQEFLANFTDGRCKRPSR